MSVSSPTQRGRFITLEGGEGVGKSSNLEFIKQYLGERLAYELVCTREPGGTPLAEEIRELFISPRDEKVHESTELLLVFAARAQHLNEFILPELNAGNWVLSDRFTDATFAYQGGGRGLSKQVIAELETLVQGELRPDLTILLDLPVELGLQRARERSDFDRMEQEAVDFFERVRQSYLERARLEPQRFCVIDASKELSAVQIDIAQCLDTFLARCD